MSVRFESSLPVDAQIQDSDAKLVAEALEVSANLTSLCLDDNRMTSIGAQYLARVLRMRSQDPSFSLRVLSLRMSETATSGSGNNDLGTAGAEAIGPALGENQSLIRLDLGMPGLRHDTGGNSISSRGAVAMAEGLSKNQTLLKLVLSIRHNSRCHRTKHLAQGRRNSLGHCSWPQLGSNLS